MKSLGVALSVLFALVTVAGPPVVAAAPSGAARIVPLVASLRVSPTDIPAGGALVTVYVRVRGATECRIASSPSFGGSIWMPCGSRAYKSTIDVGPTVTLGTRRITVSLRVRGPTGHIERMASATQLALPTSVDNYSGVSSYGLYGNSGVTALGDCTLAAVGDLLQTWDSKSGLNPGPLYSQPFLDAYDALVNSTDGGPPSASTGLSMAAVLNYWQLTGIDGNEINTFQELPDFTGRTVIEGAMTDNAAIYVSFDTPTSDLASAMDSPSTTWTTNEAPAGSSVDGGHAADIVGFDAIGPYIATWGYVQHVSWAWWATWATSAWVVRPDTADWTPNVVAPTTTSIQVSSTPNGPTSLNLMASVVVAGVTGATTGNVTVYDNGQPIAGCAPLPVSGNGQSLTGTCTTGYSTAAAPQQQLYYAEFSGDTTYEDSESSLFDFSIYAS